VSDEEDPYAFPKSKKTKLKQTTIGLAKKSVPVKRTTPEKDERPKKKTLLTQKIAVPGIKSKQKKIESFELSDVEQTAIDSDEGFVKTKAQRSKKATVIKGLSDSDSDAPAKKRYSIATEESFFEEADEADSFEFSE
jgi:hypothetical protein